MYQSPSVPDLRLSGSPVLFYNKPGSRPPSAVGPKHLSASHQNLINGDSLTSFPRISSSFSRRTRSRPNSSASIKSDPFPRQNRSSLLRQQKTTTAQELQQLNSRKPKTNIKYRVRSANHQQATVTSPISNLPMKAFNGDFDDFNLTPPHLRSPGGFRSLDVRRRRKVSSPELPLKPKGESVYDFLSVAATSTKTDSILSGLKLSVERLDDYSPRDSRKFVTNQGPMSLNSPMPPSDTHFTEPYDQLDNVPSTSDVHSEKEPESQLSPDQTQLGSSFSNENQAASKIQKFYRQHRSQKFDSETLATDHDDQSHVEKIFETENELPKQLEMKDQAASKIQHFYRKERKRKKEDKASRTIQRNYRRYRLRRDETFNAKTSPPPVISTSPQESERKQMRHETPNQSPYQNASETDALLEEFFGQSRPRRSITAAKLEGSSARSDISLVHPTYSSPVHSIKATRAAPSVANEEHPFSVRSDNVLRSSFAHFTSNNENGRAEGDFEGAVEQDILSQEHSIVTTSIKSYGRKIEKTYASSTSSSAQAVEDAPGLVSARSSLGSKLSVNTGTIPSLIDTRRSQKSIVELLEKSMIDDEERLSQISDRTPSTLRESARDERQSTTSSVLRQIFAEKKVLVELCTQLMKSMDSTGRKLLDCESRQEGRIKKLLPNSTINSESEMNHIGSNDAEERMENLRREYEAQLMEQRKIYEKSISELITELDEIKSELVDLHTLPPDVASCEEKEIQTENIGTPDSSTDGQYTEILAQAHALLSDQEELRSRLLHMAEEKEAAEREAAEKGQELDRVKQQMVQMSEEQSELNTQLSSRLSLRIEQLQQHNFNLNRQLDFRSLRRTDERSGTDDGNGEEAV